MMGKFPMHGLGSVEREILDDLYGLCAEKNWSRKGEGVTLSRFPKETPSIELDVVFMHHGGLFWLENISSLVEIFVNALQDCEE